MYLIFSRGEGALQRTLRTTGARQLVPLSLISTTEGDQDAGAQWLAKQIDAQDLYVV